MLAMLDFSNELRVFFLFCSATAFPSGAALSRMALLCLCFVLLDLSIDLGDDFANAWVGVRFDEMTEEVSQAE
jgi:hypothetical protein